MGRKSYMKYLLRDKEYNVIEKIARKLKVDCWFKLVDVDSVDVDNGVINQFTLVKDLECKYTISLQYGIRLLNDAFEADEQLNSSMLTENEIKVYKTLIKKLRIKK